MAEECGACNCTSPIRLKKLLTSIDCCKYAALQHAISCRIERGLRRMNRSYCRLMDKQKYRPENNPLSGDLKISHPEVDVSYVLI